MRSAASALALVAGLLALSSAAEAQVVVVSLDATRQSTTITFPPGGYATAHIFAATCSMTIVPSYSVDGNTFVPTYFVDLSGQSSSLVLSNPTGQDEAFTVPPGVRAVRISQQSYSSGSVVIQLTATAALGTQLLTDAVHGVAGVAPGSTAPLPTQPALVVTNRDPVPLTVPDGGIQVSFSGSLAAPDGGLPTTPQPDVSVPSTEVLCLTTATTIVTGGFKSLICQNKGPTAVAVSASSGVTTQTGLVLCPASDAGYPGCNVSEPASIGGYYCITSLNQVAGGGLQCEVHH